MLDEVWVDGILVWFEAIEAKKRNSFPLFLSSVLSFELDLGRKSDGVMVAA